MAGTKYIFVGWIDRLWGSDIASSSELQGGQRIWLLKGNCMESGRMSSFHLRAAREAISRMMGQVIFLFRQR